MLVPLLLASLLAAATPDPTAASPDRLVCGEAPLAAWDTTTSANATGFVWIQFNNTSPVDTIDVRLCVFDDQGVNRAQGNYTLGPRSAAILATPAPAEKLNASASVLFDNRARYAVGGLMDLRACKDHAAEWYGEYFNAGSGDVFASQGVMGHPTSCVPWDGTAAPPRTQVEPLAKPTQQTSRFRILPFPTSSGEAEESAWTWGGIGLAGLALGFGAFRGRDALLAGGYGLYARMRGNRVLDQGVRSQIHQLVTNEPGIHGREIALRLELAHGQTLHHLRVLTRERLLVALQADGSRHYFLSGRYGPSQMQAMSILRRPAAQRLFEAARTAPGLSLSEAAQRAGMSLPQASKVVRRLAAQGLLQVEHDARYVRLRPGPGSVHLVPAA